MTDIGSDAEVEHSSRQEAASGRPAAGEDPAKREQIIEGAHRIFMGMGFDASSMSDIAREAGVSKGTLYVYFKNKEDLFAAMVQRQKSRVFEKLQEALGDKPLAEGLHDFGVAFAGYILSDNAIRAQRIVVGVLERMPEVTSSFFKVGPNHGPTVLANFLERQVAAGRLVPLDDPVWAARQFGDLCLAGLYRQRLFCEMASAPSSEAIERNVSAAVKMFLAVYGTDKA
ncbi:MAG: TetR/AcrR family transcriptional regulator [Rhizobium sp.]|nr:TetR/AcrR family transcriptional regulator [Rhizobium sp.]